MKKSISAVALVFVAGLGLAACSSGAASSAPLTPGSSAPVEPTTDSPTTAPQTSAPGQIAAMTSTHSSTTHCAESQLRASIDPRHIPGNGTLDANGATKKGVIVDFENTSKSTCTLTGYPGAATVNAAGRQITQATRTLRGELDGLPSGSNKIPAVSLAPGHYAAAMIEGVDTQKAGAAQAGCIETLPRILVTPPNTRIAVPFKVSWPACYSFDIHPVMALPIAP